MSTSESPPSAPPPDAEPVLRGQSVVVLGPIRHACHNCGTCCTGWRVQVKTMLERRRVLAQAEVLGVRDPIVEGALRRVEGRCVFLRDDRLCAIHARFGEAEKPDICRHFPRRSRHAEDGVRIGADPGCSSTWRSFADGPELAAWPVRPSKPWPLAGDLADSERALLQLCRAPEMTVPLFIAVMTGDHSDLPGPDARFTARILGRLAKVTPYLADRENGPYVCAALAPITALLARFDGGAAPPEWRLPPEADAFALELLARHLFLRLGDETIPPVAQTMLVLGGMLACAYADPTPSVFGPALSAWSRVCRLEKFWVPVVPDRAAAQFILYGPAGVTPPDDATNR